MRVSNHSLPDIIICIICAVARPTPDRWNADVRCKGGGGWSGTLGIEVGFVELRFGECWRYIL